MCRLAGGGVFFSCVHVVRVICLWCSQVACLDDAYLALRDAPGAPLAHLDRDGSFRDAGRGFSVPRTPPTRAALPPGESSQLEGVFPPALSRAAGASNGGSFAGTASVSDARACRDAALPAAAAAAATLPLQPRRPGLPDNQLASKSSLMAVVSSGLSHHSGGSSFDSAPANGNPAWARAEPGSGDHQRRLSAAGVPSVTWLERAGSGDSPAPAGHSRSDALAAGSRPGMDEREVQGEPGACDREEGGMQVRESGPGPGIGADAVVRD
jgi:hypothetical protein